MTKDELEHNPSRWRRRTLNSILNPFVGILLLCGTLYALFFLRVGLFLAGLALCVLHNIALMRRYYSEAQRLIRVFEDVERRREQAWSPQLEAERMQLRAALPDVRPTTSPGSWLPSLGKEATVDPLVPTTSLYVRGIELANIRCFRHFALGLEHTDGPYLTTILLGDNASGKTTILRSLALGLCQESDAISLIKTLPGSFLREGASLGSILIHVRSEDRTFEGSIRTTIEHSGGGEIIRQRTEPAEFPWDRVFMCGYGTQRTSGRPTSHQSYLAPKAVATLFSDSADLLNPEVVLLRRDEITRRRLADILKRVLLLDATPNGITSSERGVELEGPWGAQPLAVVSDGYRSTSQWVLDYLGWQMFANRLRDDALDGVLLIDELEQHLHPRWQRHLLQRLRSQFDRTQIVASSHTPLLAAGVADMELSQVIRLIPAVDGTVEAVLIPSHDLTGKRADQILSDAFGLVTSKSPGSVTKLDRMTELLSSDRTASEDDELADLKHRLDASWSSGEHSLMRAADKAVSKVLDEMVDEGLRGLDAPVKSRLLELFDSREPKQ